MLLYLVQHADAEREEDDPARPLSEKGLQDCRKVASYLSRRGIILNQILYSKKLRARQTAGIIAEVLTVENYKDFAESEGLLPLDNPGIWDDRLKYLTDDLMLVGLMPHLGKLASLLLCGDAEKAIVSFQTASVVCLERDDRGSWSLQWMTTPGTVP